MLGGAMNELGWHWWPSDAQSTRRPMKTARPASISAIALSGCAQGAKASTDVTYWPLADPCAGRTPDPMPRRRIETDADRMATGAYYSMRTASKRFQPAAIVIMACNGIGTPRLLLNSASEQFPGWAWRIPAASSART